MRPAFAGHAYAWTRREQRESKNGLSLGRLGQGDSIECTSLDILLQQIEVSVELDAKGRIFHGGIGSEWIILISIKKKEEIVLRNGQKINHSFGS